MNDVRVGCGAKRGKFTGMTERTPDTRTRTIGDAAGVLLLAMGLGALGGVAWGLLRPAQKVTFMDGGRLGVAHSGLDATFTALLWFTGLALVAGLALGVLAYRRFPRSRGLGMEAWAGVAALAAAALMMVAGNSVAALRQPDYSGANIGDSFDVVPAFGTPVAMLAAPFAAMLAYWCLMFILGDRAPDGADALPVGGGGDGSD